jgi:hypothetical protein
MTLRESADQFKCFRRAEWPPNKRCFFTGDTIRVRETLNETPDMDAPYLILSREDLTADDWGEFQEAYSNLSDGSFQCPVCNRCHLPGYECDSIDPFRDNATQRELIARRAGDAWAADKLRKLKKNLEYMAATCEELAHSMDNNNPKLKGA